MDNNSLGSKVFTDTLTTGYWIYKMSRMFVTHVYGSLITAFMQCHSCKWCLDSKHLNSLSHMQVLPLVRAGFLYVKRMHRYICSHTHRENQLTDAVEHSIYISSCYRYTQVYMSKLPLRTWCQGWWWAGELQQPTSTCTHGGAQLEHMKPAVPAVTTPSRFEQRHYRR